MLLHVKIATNKDWPMTAGQRSTNARNGCCTIWLQVLEFILLLFNILANRQQTTTNESEGKLADESTQHSSLASIYNQIICTIHRHKRAFIWNKNKTYPSHNCSKFAISSITCNRSLPPASELAAAFIGDTICRLRNIADAKPLYQQHYSIGYTTVLAALFGLVIPIY